MVTPISRRTLLAAGAALAVAAACGGSDDDDTTTATDATEPEGSQQGPDQLEVILATAQLLAGVEQRVTAGVLLDAEPLTTADGVQFSFGRDLSKMGKLQPAEYHAEGIEDRPYYKSTFRFDEPGQWFLGVQLGDKQGTTALRVIDPSTSKVPIPGAPMIPVTTPTTASSEGVDPICTADPVCPFHAVSLDAALKAGKPVAAVFSTPALCQSRVCGPVLGVLVDEATPFADRIQFVHVEVYRSLEGDFSKRESLSPGMLAYNLTFEPVVFFAGADGIVRERLDGPYDAVEARGALERLAAQA